MDFMKKKIILSLSSSHKLILSYAYMYMYNNIGPTIFQEEEILMIVLIPRSKYNI